MHIVIAAVSFYRHTIELNSICSLFEIYHDISRVCVCLLVPPLYQNDRMDLNETEYGALELPVVYLHYRYFLCGCSYPDL